MTDFLFYGLSILSLFSALMVVLAKNPIHSVLYLILTFFSLSGHYILLNAQFLAAVNIIVYAGAIMVLFLFVIMFLNLNKETEPHKSNLVKFAAVVAGGMLLVIMVGALRGVDTGTYSATNFNSQIGLVENLGIVLFRDFLLPFELTSVLFLTSMVGAVMLGKREANS
jgi:NADH-quinone oxidoreductase subunit J